MLEQVSHFGRLGVIHLDKLGAQTLELLDLLARFELKLFARRDLVGRRDQNDITRLALIEALGFQDDVHGLVPGDVLQAQGQVTFDRIRYHQVEPGKVREQLKYGTHLDILEVKRQAFAGKAELGLLFLFFLFLGDWCNLDGVNAIGLVCEMFEVPVGADRQANIRPILNRVDEVDRGGEVTDVHAALQLLG